MVLGGYPFPEISNFKLRSNNPNALKHPVRCRKATGGVVEVAGSLADDIPGCPVILARQFNARNP